MPLPYYQKIVLKLVNDSIFLRQIKLSIKCYRILLSVGIKNFMHDVLSDLNNFAACPVK